MIQVLPIQTKKSVRTHKIWYNFLHSIIHIDIIVLLVTCIDKLNVVLSFQNLENIDIVFVL